MIALCIDLDGQPMVINNPQAICPDETSGDILVTVDIGHIFTMDHVYVTSDMDEVNAFVRANDPEEFIVKRNASIDRRFQTSE